VKRDLSLGMFEIANCFLEGVGAKKAPDVALSYLRFAGNLGDIAAQERELEGVATSLADAKNWGSYCQKAGVGSRKICKSSASS